MNANRVRLLVALILTAPLCALSAQRTVATDMRTDPDTRLAQALLARAIDVRIDKLPLSRAIESVATSVGTKVIYRQDLVAKYDTLITIHVSRTPLGIVLERLLTGTNLTVSPLPEGRIAIVERAGDERVQPATGTITGAVTDAKTGQGVAGATVVVEGIQRGTATNDAGQYRITGVAAGSYTLTARRIGYRKMSQTITVTSGQETTANFLLTASASPLDQVVVTGTIIPTEVRALPTPVSIVTAEDIQRQNVSHIDQIFRGSVPGAIAWNDPAHDYYATIAVRGTNSLYRNGIKTYVDGVEVNDPIYITQIDPASIERVEISRGPEASTIYGSDASGGVMQIFTKKGVPGLRHPEVQAKLSAGAIGGTWGANTAMQQDHSLRLLGGSEHASYNIGGSFVKVGAWTPGNKSQTDGVSGGTRLEQGRLTTELSGRYSDKFWDDIWNVPLRDAGYVKYSKPPYTAWDTHNRSLGVHLAFAATSNWQNNLTAGFEEFDLNAHTTQARLTTPGDTMLTYIASTSLKRSAAYNTTLDVPLGGSSGITVTAGADHSQRNVGQQITGGARVTTGNIAAQNWTIQSIHLSNTGAFGQTQVNIARRLYLTAGLRADHNSEFGSNIGTAWSPRFGASFVQGVGAATVKLRGSYGEAINAPQPFQKDSLYSVFQIQHAAPNLGPERQRGGDIGVDLTVGAWGSLSVTYYDQHADDLIDDVLLPPTTAGGSPTFQYQNFGQIENSGVESEAHVNLSSTLRVGGTYSVTNSIVRGLSSGYTGSLQVGDRMPSIPTHVVGANVAYTPTSRTTLNAFLTHVGSFVATDWLSLYGFYYGGIPYRGSDRAYWMAYPGFTKVNISASQVISANVTGFVNIDNVGGVTTPEHDNSEPAMGRLVMAGVRLKY